MSSISEGGFIVAQGHGGGVIAVAVDTSTQFTTLCASRIGDLKIGDTLVVRGHIDSETGNVAARCITRLVTDRLEQIDKQITTGRNIVGVISSVSPLTIQTRSGKSLTVKTAAASPILTCKPGTISDLSDSSMVSVTAVQPALAAHSERTDAVAAPVLARSVEITPQGLIAIGLSGLKSQPYDDSTMGRDEMPVAALSSLHASAPTGAASFQRSDDEAQISDRSGAALPLKQPDPSIDSDVDEQPDSQPDVLSQPKQD